jgi:hypothetical protein
VNGGGEEDAALHWRAVSTALDAGTAVCAGLNSVYFLGRLLSGDERRPSRLAAIAVLTLWSLAVLLEALALLALAAAPADVPAFGSLGWTVVRLLPLAASAGVSA